MDGQGRDPGRPGSGPSDGRGGGPAGPDPRGALAALIDLVRILPVPNARPVFARQDEAAGLTLLDLGLRMDHVQRVTESLTLIDRTHIRRSMALDVDLRRLTTAQRQALAVRPLGPIEAPGPAGDDRAGAGSERGLLWLPVAWQSRDHVASVVIHDECGAVVPRLTGEATWKALTSALTRLLKNQLAARAITGAPEAAGLPGLQSRWLIERAVAVLVERGLTAAWGRMAALAVEDGPGTERDRGADRDGDRGEAGDPRAARASAVAYLRSMPSAAAAEFGYLLDLAAREQLLVAMVPASASHPHLQLEGAPIPVLAPSGGVRLRARDLLPVNREYTVEYRTQVPRQVTAYHLTIEVPEEIRVRRFMLTTDADEIAVDELTRDLDRIVGRLRPADGDAGGPGAGGPGAGAPGPVEESELEDALARVASLSRLRFAGLQSYREYVRRFRARFGWELPVAERSRRTAEQVVQALAAGRCDLTLLAALAVHVEHGALLPRLRALPAPGRAAALATLRDYLREADLGRDVTVDNDPRDHGAHVYWRHVDLRFGPKAMEPVTAGFHLALADEPPALVESVVRMLVSLLAVLGLLWWLLQGSEAAGLQSDALVAVLLLVPGILLSRLDLPKGRSILGELRAFPRRIAYTSVVLTSGVALVAASDATDLVSAVRAGAMALLALLGLSLVELGARSVRRRAKVPRSAAVPRWLAEAMDVRRPGRPPSPPDARFLSVGGLAARTARLESPLPRPADLVGRAAETAAAGTTALAFEVVHAPGVAATHAVEGGHSLRDDCPRATDLLGLSAFGSTFEIRTRQTCEPAAIQPAGRPPRFLLNNARVRAGGRSRASGLVVLQQGSHAPAGQQGEFLVVLGDHEDSSIAQTLMTTHVLAELARRLVDVRGLPLFLHAPAAPRPRMRTATERARPAVLPVLRLGLSDAEPHAGAGAAFAAAAAALADEYGLGLAFGAGRASASVNHWDEIVPFRRGRYHQVRRERFGDQGEGRAGEATMVTIVGPGFSRVAQDVHQLAGAFDRLGLGCLALSAWTMQRTLFVNALLPCRPGHVRGREDPWGPPSGLAATDVVPLGRVVHECSLLRQPPDGGRPLPAGLPQRFAIVLASRSPVTSERPTEPGGTGAGRDVPFWVTWDVPAPADVDVITFRLTHAFAVEGRQARVTFLRARRTRTDRLRGRAKVSVRVPGSWRTADLGTLARRVATRARAAVADDFPGRPGAVTVEVAWGERWLGTPP